MDWTASVGAASSLEAALIAAGTPDIASLSFEVADYRPGAARVLQFGEAKA